MERNTEEIIILPPSVGVLEAARSNKFVRNLIAVFATLLLSTCSKPSNEIDSINVSAETDKKTPLLPRVRDYQILDQINQDGVHTKILKVHFNKPEYGPIVVRVWVSVDGVIKTNHGTENIDIDGKLSIDKLPANVKKVQVKPIGDSEKDTPSTPPEDSHLDTFFI